MLSASEKLNKMWEELYEQRKVRWSAGMSTQEGGIVLATGWGSLPVFAGGQVQVQSLNNSFPAWWNEGTVLLLTQQARDAWGNPGLSFGLIPSIPKGMTGAQYLEQSMESPEYRGPEWYWAVHTGKCRLQDGLLMVSLTDRTFDSEEEAILTAISMAPGA